MARPKTQPEIQVRIDALKKLQAKVEQALGFSLSPKHGLVIKLAILEGRHRYSDYANEKQEVESIAYETSQWMKGEYFDDEAELFGE